MNGPIRQLSMILQEGRYADFLPLLQTGFGVRCRPGCSLEELLCKQWGIPADYVKTRITTIFMNNRAVDDLAAIVVNRGAVIALSGAMPGLVGATMRRGGFYAAMRGAMTCREDNAGTDSGSGPVRVKLFNLLLRELGPGFLARGVIVTAAELSAFLVAGEFVAEDFIVPPTLDNRPLTPTGLAAALAALGAEELLLTVDFKDTP